MAAWLSMLVLLVAVCVTFAGILRVRNVDLILKNAITRRKDQYQGTRHVFFCLVDHYEPYWKDADKKLALRRVENWVKRYPTIADRLRDSSGRPPQHNFFYPAEEYDPECVAMLASLQRQGYGSVEVHLHHDRDTSEGLKEKLVTFTSRLHRDHGLLHKNTTTGKVEYAFIHGMSALDDSGPGGRWCGVKNEIMILKETGCYADFTFPSAPSSTQPPILNRIYYAIDDPTRSHSHHKGVEVEFGKPPAGDLLLVTGPLAINWWQRRRLLFPAIETSELSANNPPTRDRVETWLRVAITVKEWPRWVFVKIHTHGAQEAISEVLLRDGLNLLYSHLLQYYDGRPDWVLHFVQPREIYYCVKALESASPSWINQIENFDYAPPSQQLF